MQIQSIFSVLVAATVVRAALNEPCIGADGDAGVCVSSSSCEAAGGTSVTGACPSDPTDIKCCTKASCSTNSSGNCRWTSDCDGSEEANLCPGPTAMKCCKSQEEGFGGYDSPSIPSTSSGCESVAIAGAELIVDAFPGRVREVFCIRACSCGSGSSDHCCGKATDMMCADSGGAPTMSGTEIAEWVMENRSALDLKYVIWGQRIWNPSQDSEAPWTEWRAMEDRGDVTQNHWDHVHVSYN